MGFTGCGIPYTQVRKAEAEEARKAAVFKSIPRSSSNDEIALALKEVCD